MQIRKFGHACLLVEDGGARVLLDPGSFSHGWEELRDLTAVLVTHQHADHLDLDRIGGLLAVNPGVPVYADSESVAALAGRGHTATAVAAEQHLNAGDLTIETIGTTHAVIHPDIPVIPNVGYLMGGRLFHPGDALTVPDRPVDVLGVPTAAPWLKAAEAVDFLRAVRPQVAIPIHEAIATVPQLYYNLFEQLAPDGTSLVILDDGNPREF